MSETTPTVINLGHVKERLFNLRWLSNDGGSTPAFGRLADITVGGPDRAVLAHLLGVDLPALISEVERLRYRADEDERERDTLRQSIAQRAAVVREAVASNA
jgi:hypothetical protein